MSIRTAEPETGTRPVAPPPARRPRRGRSAALPYALVAPAIIFVALLALIPAVQSIFESFRRNDLTVQNHDFIWFQNYIATLTDTAFIQAAGNTLVYVAVGLILALVLGMIMALWLQSLRGVARAIGLIIVILPWAVPGTVAGNIWGLIFNPTSSGLLNSVLRSTGIIEQNQVWIAEPFWGLVFIALPFCWGILPLGAILLLAGLESVPRELYEQSVMDGANRIQQFFRITVPLIRPAIAIILVNAGVASIGIYDQVYVLAGNDPDRISVIGKTYLYAFRDFNFGLGYAASVIATVATLLISLIFLRTVYREEKL